jgi:hypothetical protein
MLKTIAQPQIDQTLTSLQGHIFQAMHSWAREADVSRHCGAIAVLLDMLPLATADFALAASHVNNALTYLEEGELGAARLELRLILGLVRWLRYQWGHGAPSRPEGIRTRNFS